MKLLCPNNHAAVVREDPESEHKIAMCDFCGWSASYRVAQESRTYEPNGHGDELERSQIDERRRREQMESRPDEQRPQLPAGARETQGSGQQQQQRRR